MISCPTCDGPMHKILCAGLPMRLCEDDKCSSVSGVFAWVAYLLAFNGTVYIYEDTYFDALFLWMIGAFEEV